MSNLESAMDFAEQKMAEMVELLWIWWIVFCYFRQVWTFRVPLNLCGIDINFE